MKTFALKPLNWALAAAATLLSLHGAAQAETLLLRQPSVSADRLAFVYGGDIWVSRRDGSEPRQLTSQASAEYAPKFSPDGRWIAFTANYDGNPDVYVMPAEGGEPRRLTWHPGADVVNGWSPDGKRVLFASAREIANSRSNQLFEVPVEGGPERKLMKAVAFEGAWNADGERLAYRPNRKAHEGAAGWRLSRGGATPPIWIINLKTQQLEKVPHVRATDHTPLWHGDELVFVSDRNDGAANLYSWNGKTQQLRQLTRSKSWDVRSAGLHGSTVVYEMGGSLHQLDLKSGQDLTLSALPPGARVLDACAAPGGKTAHLLELQSLDLLALDADPERLARVEDNLRRLRLQAEVRAVDARQTAQWWDGRPFDAILLDAPCSASGIVRRHPDVRWLRRPEDIPQLARIQAELLDALWPLLKPGGRLVYATCSLFKAEGQEQVDAFLQRQPDAMAVECAGLTGHLLPVPDNGAQDAVGQAVPLDGFFYALLLKSPASNR